MTYLLFWGQLWELNKFSTKTQPMGIRPAAVCVHARAATARAAHAAGDESLAGDGGRETW